MEKLKRTLRSKSLLKYFLIYLSCFMMILVIFLGMIRESYRILKKNVMKSSNNYLEEKITRLENDISKLSKSSDALYRSQSFALLQHTDGSMDKANILAVKNVHDQFRSLKEAISSASQEQMVPYGLLLFRSNDIIADTERCSDRYKLYYNTFLTVEYNSRQLNAEEFKDLLFEPTDDFRRYIKLDSITFPNKAGKILTIKEGILIPIGNLSDRNTAMYILMSSDALYHSFMEQYITGGYIRVLYKGNTLVNKGTGNEADKNSKEKNDYIFKKKSTVLGWDIEMGLDEKIIDNQMIHIKYILGSYIVLGIAGMFLLAFLMSYRQYLSIQKLFDSFDGIPDNSGGGNDYIRLGNMIENILTQNDNYQQLVEESIQENEIILMQDLILRGVSSPNIVKLINKHFNNSLEFFCVVVIQMPRNMDRVQVLHMYLDEKIKQFSDREYDIVQTSEGELTLILSMSAGEEPTTYLVEKLLTDIMKDLTDIGTDETYQFAVSSIGTCIKNIHTCYNQAKQMLIYNINKNQSFVVAYKVDDNSMRDNNVNIENLNSFYRTLINGEKDQAQHILDKLISNYKKMPFRFENSKQTAFYSVYNTIQSASQNYPEKYFADLEVCHPCDDFDINEFENMLTNFVEKYFRAIAKYKLDSDNNLEKRLVSYIDNNYQRADLTISIACRDNSITPTLMNETLKKYCGMTFAACLENKRVQEAKSYLKYSDFCNEKIADKVGFGAVNTFYRVFQKCTYMTPGQYREPHTAENQHSK